ncbi:abortive infection family protein [Bacillus sp. NP157]|nr:abortive infection family protein [Bacillus sp. NP157]
MMPGLQSSPDGYAYLLQDQSVRGPLILALKRAIAGAFTKSDWVEFGYSTQTSDLISSHPRLLRSLDFGDDDYEACVFGILEYVFDRTPQALPALLTHTKLKAALEATQPDLLERFGVVTSRISAPPVDQRASESVWRALRDVDTLLSTGGPVHVVDRLHTALHGYLRQLCADHRIPLSPDASLTTAFKAYRQAHAGNPPSPHAAPVAAVLQSLASAVDAVNAMRNSASIAHPNAQLLTQAEAELVVNTVRTLMHYLKSTEPPH